MITFFEEQGGHIDFAYDKENFYAVSQHGTSVPLWEGELIFVRTRKCKCSNKGCVAKERHFLLEDIKYCSIRPKYRESNTQVYAVKYKCWVCVQLFDQDKVDAQCPQGFEPCVATFENGVYHVHEFLWS